MSIPRVFDAHVHVQPWHMLHPAVHERLWRDRPGAAEILATARDPGRLLRFLDAEGIETAVLVNYVSPEVMGFTEEANTWIAEFVRGHEDRLIAMGSVHPRLTLDALAQIYETAARLGMPLMVHTGTSIFPGARNRFADPMPLDDVACDFPDLRLILAHGGRPLYMETCLFLVRRHPNVWMDVSGIPPKSLLEYFPKLERIASRVLWGTDWPGPGVPSPRRNVEEFWALPLAEASKRRILGENASLLFTGTPRVRTLP